MNIMHTESMGVRGGEPKRVIDELLIIRELGHSPFLLCRPDTWLEAEALRHDIPVLHAPILRAVDPASLRLISRYIRRHRIDIVHAHNSKDSYSALVAARLHRIPFIRSRHNDLVKRPGPIYAWADRIVTTGEKIRRELIAYGYAPEKIVSIPSYPDERLFVPDDERRSSFRRRYDIGTDEVVIGTLTGYNPRKSPHLILEPLAELLREFPRLRFLVAGPDDKPKYREEFQGKLSALGLEKRVVFLGYVDATEFLDGIDIYVCPSRKEGVPQAVMQAMMMGKPVLSTDVGGIPDLNPDGNLLLCPSGDPACFTTQLRRLLGEPALHSELGTRNRSLALERFNRSQMIRLMKELYEGVTR